jgi:hypothetical protein
MNTTMRIHAFRTLAAVAAVSLITACSDSSPVGLETSSDATLAKGSGSTVGSTTKSTASKVEIILSRPANAVFASAKGKAKFASKPSERELQIEVENIPAGTAVVFMLDGAAIGTATANTLREARLNLNSTLGQTVPMSVTGKSVTVMTAAGGAIVAGSF